MRIKFASQKGAAMVEFALILIPLLLIYLRDYRVRAAYV